MHGVYKTIVAALISYCFTLTAFSQQTYDINGLRDLTNYWEINATVGANEFLGDLGGNIGIGRDYLKDYTFRTNKLLLGLSGTYNKTNYLAFNFGFNFTKVTGADSLIHNTGNMERWRWYRNLSFKSNIFELYASGTFYPEMYFHRKTVELYRWDPFISLGVGFFHFNPKTLYNGQWVNLRPLHLEGEGFPEYPDRKQYALTKVYIPINFGVKYYFDNKWAISGGLMTRCTFTDYIDDIHTTYIDPNLFYKYLSPEKAFLASQLYSRSITPWKVKPDIIKADHTDNDSYITFFIALHIRLDKYTPFYYPNL